MRLCSCSEPWARSSSINCSWVAASTPGAAPSLPEPTGPHPVGVTSLHLTDPTRVDPWVPGDGTKLVLPTWHIIPDVPREGLIVTKAVLFLLGTRMDFRTDKLSAQFVFENPNQTSACGCGESVAITPASADRLDAGATA